MDNEAITASVLAKTAGAKCPFCPSSKWRQLPGLMGLSVAQSDSDQPHGVGGPEQAGGNDRVTLVVMPGVGFACEGCGFVRFHI